VLRARPASLLLVSVGAAVALAACSGPGTARPVGATARPTSPSPQASVPGPTPKPSVVTARWPLTGAPRPAGSAAHAALTVKIENTPDARPQRGLNGADVVFEELVEGGISRFAAVYHSQLPDVVGPVRSIRPMDPPLAAQFAGLFAYSGGQRPFVDALHASASQDVGIDRATSAYYRDGAKVAPHNLMLHPAKALARADARHRSDPKALAAFATDAAGSTAATAGSPAGSLNLRFSTFEQPRWTWTGSAWVRSERSTPATSSGERISAANVIVLRVAVHNTPYHDPIGTPVPETVLAGASGTGLVASDGRTVAVRWSKAGASGPLVLKTASGGTLRLAPGRSWIELVPQTGSVSVS
jgi:hypothetical protein